MPKKWMCCNFYYCTLSFCNLIAGIITKLVKIVELYGYDWTGLWILYLKMIIIKWELQPVISIKLWNQIALRINKGKLSRVSAKHAFANVKFKLLLFSCFFQSIEKYVVDCTFTTSNDCFFPILIHEYRLMLKNDLLF